jgi:glycosyltransferase involved in cell wall biosynthesis
MKIAVCYPVDLNYCGGAEKHILRLSEAIRGLGVDITVFGKEGPRSRGGDCDGELAGEFYPLREMDYRRYDIIHTHSGFYHPRLWELQMKRLARQRWVHTLHTVSLDYLFGCRDWLNWRCYYSTFIEGLWSRYADHVIAVSGSVRDWALKSFRLAGGKVSVVHNGYDPKSFTGADRGRIRAELGLAPEHVVLLFVGRGEDKVKGSHQVAAAVESLSGRYPQVRLLAIPGTGFKGAKWLCPTGYVPHQRIADYYVAADIFVNASFSEGMPLTVVEAMAAGLPIVAAPVGGIPEVIEHERTGLLLRKDHSDLGEQLARLIEDVSLRKRLGEKAGEAAKTLTWDHIARQTLELYQRLL